MNLPWYKWFVGDWLTSETRFRLSLIERGLYRELLDLHYAEGSIPADENVLRRMASVSDQEFTEAWPNVAGLFTTDPGNPNRLINARAAGVIAEQRKFLKTQKLNGKRGGRPKKTDGLAKQNPTQTQQKPMGFENETQKKARARASEPEQNRTDEDTSTPNVVDVGRSLSLPTQPTFNLGEFGNAKLTEEELHKLHELIGPERTNAIIDKFDTWVSEDPTGKVAGGKRRKDRNPYKTIRRWISSEPSSSNRNGNHGRRTNADESLDNIADWLASKQAAG